MHPRSFGVAFASHPMAQRVKWPASPTQVLQLVTIPQRSGVWYLSSVWVPSHLCQRQLPVVSIRTNATWIPFSHAGRHNPSSFSCAWQSLFLGAPGLNDNNDLHGSNGRNPVISSPGGGIPSWGAGILKSCTTASHDEPFSPTGVPHSWFRRNRFS